MNRNYTGISKGIRFLITPIIYLVVRKIRADFEEKLKRRFKFLISFIKFKSFAARIFWTTQ